ncbi:MAG: sigma-54 dependent transcriptional regulator [Deltaproteobacteria bacterium]|jgi:DNA-binding NtrC family response regulator|nr:sigma-54 dependent transcriptional regulator [Deltaproteobacteria bacterium]
MNPKILVIDADLQYRSTFRILLENDGYQVTASATAKEALSLASEEEFDLIVLDMKLVELPSLDVLGFIKNNLVPERRKAVQRLLGDNEAAPYSDDVPVIAVDSMRSEEIESRAMRLGAFKFIVKGGDNKELKAAVQKALESRKARAESRYDKFVKPFLGENSAFNKVLDLVDKIADSSSPVLITGESGVGKEIVAQLIYQKSPRSDNSLVVFNCTGVTKDMIDDALFGHVKNAFTGAARERKGILRASDKGTIFLDEIGETTIDFQAKLLRAIQFGEVQTVGTDKISTVDVRFLAATNRDVEKEIEAGRFRLDLFYRFPFVVEVPSLRERSEDIPKLAVHLLKDLAKRNQKKEAPAISEEVMRILCEHPWPGNIRQLENVLEYGLVMAKGGVILREHLPDYIFRKPSSSGLPKSIAEAESGAIIEALHYVKGVRTKAATLLGIAPKTLRDKIDRYNLNHLFPVGAESGQEDSKEDAKEDAKEEAKDQAKDEEAMEMVELKKG